MSIEPEKIIGTKLSSSNFEVTSHAWILYAIGIGFSSDNLDLQDLKFTYEKHKEFSMFPTFIGSYDVGLLYDQFKLPGLTLPHISNFLIGEQTVEIHKQIPIGSTVGSSIEFIDVADKKSGALVTARKDYWIVRDNQTAINKEDIWVSVTMKVFMVGMGGFGFKGNMKHFVHKLPDREPDDVIIEKTTKNQAIIYRLSGDDNPLHIDPSQSKEIGFDIPILHGMWTFGIISRAIFKKYWNNDQSLIKWVSNRFTSHVLPGETLMIETFKEHDFIHFRVKSDERRKIVSFGYIQLRLKAKI